MKFSPLNDVILVDMIMAYGYWNISEVVFLLS